MSIYDNRDKPAYDIEIVDTTAALNSYILQWWSQGHDDLILKCVQEHQWYWFWQIPGRIRSFTDSATLAKWQAEDPACKRHQWQNTLIYFSVARARSLNLLDQLRAPSWKSCPLCHQEFIENSLPEPLAKRLGVNHLDFCAPCLSTRVLQNTGQDASSKEEVLRYLQSLSSLLGTIPHQAFGEGIEDFLYLSFDERVKVLRLLTDKPRTSQIKRLFKSWLQALIASGILSDGTRKTARGTTCIARDGHMCFSLAEKTIDDFLVAHKIPHKKEPHYPGSNYRADFLIRGVYVEYFGLAGNPDYDERIAAKKSLAELHGLRILPIYAKDLINYDLLKKMLLSIKEEDDAS